jgi:hypothetical protein
MYVNTTLFTFSHRYMFQSSSGHLHGVLINFVSRVNKIVSKCKYRIKQQRVVCYEAVVIMLVAVVSICYEAVVSTYYVAVVSILLYKSVNKHNNVLRYQC